MVPCVAVCRWDQHVDAQLCLSFSVSRCVCSSDIRANTEVSLPLWLILVSGEWPSRVILGVTRASEQRQTAGDDGVFPNIEALLSPPSGRMSLNQ
jgi:hypothetical protein